ncbi:MAG: nicotinate-nucleotide adenylyltransferase [candidate division KSB1 bacterium]|nr:nicotinate-nucleotide adenylyltransferase [candidate division KSB1 bacterium]MDZ7275459.1 nicotinate-nucleotide adenylyltransferase [candidate division KSB1 bacterium]MDZ7286229.1 nicotinate-nucleotide adenylyltransferase [candidate division KSB1 bacterium]MDZ7296455.1 nicotinate-nucleotide adenylyltransferase [candidate division KSB1 bacterium]MDZ7307251.1 nicotinate-nucleotide adenylyltransferase [candidate division KSB1 bacterium]
MRVGILGGTFDPVHYGHLVMAECACEELQLERMLFMLAPRPPHKNAVQLTPVAHRLTMLRAAIADNPRFEVSTLELERAGPSYTVDTLRLLTRQPEYAGAEFYLIIGADSLAEFHKWREPATIRSLARVAVYPRPEKKPGIAHTVLNEADYLLRGSLIGISSTDIRLKVKNNRSIRYLVPPAVAAYIDAHGLYK